MPGYAKAYISLVSAAGIAAGTCFDSAGRTEHFGQYQGAPNSPLT
jgi:hypothetical protein